MKYVKGWYIPNHMNSPGNHLRRSGVIEHALHYLPREERGACIQAGGHIGIWPSILSNKFNSVYTWEPIEENWECLKANTDCVDNLKATFGCLGEQEKVVRMRYSERNTGKHCVVPDGELEANMTTIDNLNLHELSAMFLDVEGYELKVLMGAHSTLHNLRPKLLVLEENGLQARYGIADEAVGNYLKTFGYVEKDRYEEDVIYVLEMS